MIPTGFAPQDKSKAIMKLHYVYAKYSRLAHFFLTGLIHKMHARIANREDPDQTASSEAEQSGPEVIKLFSYSTQLSTKFQLLIKNKIPTNEEVSCFKSLRCCIYHAYKR